MKSVGLVSAADLFSDGAYDLAVLSNNEDLFQTVLFLEGLERVDQCPGRGTARRKRGNGNGS